ncbi:MAG: hypothetical protein O3A46_01495, partial [Candidatus Poribacteria bacterium]|nr:hypothetical protein [Candidatus Poribacteria bacterium]
MDRRTLIFIFLATAIFVLWSVMQRPKTLPVEPGSEDAGVVSESGEFAETTAPDGATPSVTSTGAVSGRIEAEANAVRQSAATRVVSAAYDVEVAHATASLRAWRLENYPDRDPAGQLENHPVDLIPTYSPDYGGLLLGAERLMWEPLETYSDRIQLATPTDSTTLAFRAYHGDLEIVKTFTFHGTTQQLVDHGGDEAWRGYAVDIDVTFRNLGEATTDLAA